MKYAQERRLSGVLQSDDGAADLHKVSALQLISYDISVVTFFYIFLSVITITLWTDNMHLLLSVCLLEREHLTDALLHWLIHKA